MNDLRPLLDSSGTDLDEPELAALLRAARAEQPSARALPALAAALGVTAALASTAATSALAGGQLAAQTAANGAVGVASGQPWLVASLAAVGKYFAVGIGLGLVAITTVPRLTSPAPRSAAIAPSDLAIRARTNDVAIAVEGPSLLERMELGVQPALAESGRPAASSRLPVAKPSAIQPVAAEPVPLPSEPAAPPVALARETLPPASVTPDAAPAAPVAGSVASLAAEVAVLDRARAALAAGNFAAALSLVGEYQRMPRSGTLDREAALLRIRALDRAGQRELASRLAREYWLAHPESREIPVLKGLAGKRP